MSADDPMRQAPTQDRSSFYDMLAQKLTESAAS